MTKVDQTPKTDLEKSIAVLSGKVAWYTELFAYYDGNQTLKYNTARMKEIFKNLSVDFTENWCSVVIDSTYNRVNLKDITIKTDEEMLSKLRSAIERVARRLGIGKTTTEEKLSEILSRNQLVLESDDVHEVAGIIGESFYIVWPNEEGMAEGFYNDPRMVHLFYQDANPRLKKFAAKWWKTDEKRVRMTLYYPERIEKYSTGVVSDFKDLKAEAFHPIDDEGKPVEMGEHIQPNEFGEVPVFQFRPELRKIKSDLKNVIGPQDMINKMLADMIVTSEFSAFKQRFIISNDEILGTLKNAPNEIWDIPAGDGQSQGTAVGELSASDPSVYIKPVDREVNAISAITQTPKHFFLSEVGGQISGEALIVLESPINKKAGNRIDLFSPQWVDVAVFMLKVEGEEVDPRTVIAVFDDPATIQPKTRADIRKVEVDTGIPLVTVLRRQGWSDAEIDQMLVDKEEAMNVQNRNLAEAILEQTRKIDNPELGDGFDLDDEAGE